MDISIIVATFNRADHLRHALTSLQAANVPAGMSCEVLVVDNNSTDGTRAVVEPFLTNRPVTFRYVVEHRQGKSFALNTGLREAAGSVLAFTDDDCIVDGTWIETIISLLGCDESLDGVGGRVELYDKRDRPVSIRTDPQPHLCSITTLFSSIIGCNMALDKRVFDAVGIFDPMFGPGNVAGEDIDLVYRAQRSGLRIMYAPEMVVYHDHGRRTDADVQKIRREYIGGHGAFYAKHILRADWLVFRMGFRDFSITLRSLVRELWTGQGEKRGELWWLVRGFLYGLTAAHREQ